MCVSIDRARPSLFFMNARRAGVEDLEILLPLFVEYREFYHEPACLGESRQFLFERLSNLQSVIFLTFDELEAPSGFAQLYPSYNSLSLKPIYILHDLFVLPSFRGRGYGALLLETVREYALRQSASEIVLQTAKDNVKAQSLYALHGYVRDENFFSYSHLLEGRSATHDRGSLGLE
jgi:GNAT superfamily N-acetyltransferase